MPRRKSKRQIAKEARERHERLYKRSMRETGRSGITKLRLRVSDALRERMRAEQEAGSV